MDRIKKPVMILMAEDDEDYQVLIRDASRAAGINIPIVAVNDGEELINYLLYPQPGQTKCQLPNLIILDLNMPKVDGRKAIEEIKKNDALRQIPVIVLTTSSSEEDVNQAYAAGANSFITKPDSFSALVEIMKTIRNFWFEIAALP